GRKKRRCLGVMPGSAKVWLQLEGSAANPVSVRLSGGETLPVADHSRPADRQVVARAPGPAGTLGAVAMGSGRASRSPAGRLRRREIVQVFSHIGPRSTGPDRQVDPSVPSLWPSTGPERHQIPR
ncbi:MAG: hypothetical protein AAF334_04890, partial [Pseudomonadota bacterium]